MALADFVKQLHPSSKVICEGTVHIEGRVIPAVMIRNLYGQLIAWGMFSVEKGKFKGKLANTANTESAYFRWPRTIPMCHDELDGIHPAAQRMLDIWRYALHAEEATKH